MVRNAFIKGFSMIRYFIAALLVIGFSSAAQASETAVTWENTCDPEQDLLECRFLAGKYEKGRAPFPKDPARAEHLRNMAATQATRGCDAGDLDSCMFLVDGIIHDRGLTVAAQLDQIGTIAETDERNCAQSIPDACYHRGYVYGIQALGLVLAHAEAQGENVVSVNTQTEEESDVWMARAEEMASMRIANLRPDCAVGETEACLQIAYEERFLDDYALERLEILTSICGTGGQTACEHIGSALFNRVVSDTQRVGTFLSLEQFCEAGNGAACDARQSAFPRKQREEKAAFVVKGCDRGMGQVALPLDAMPITNGENQTMRRIWKRPWRCLNGRAGLGISGPAITPNICGWLRINLRGRRPQGAFGPIGGRAMC